tara:strand:- start:236 stop:1069 length:834 start_codon:yes stop_codon:yes gene_type:complete
MRKELARYCDRMKIVFLLFLTVYPGLVFADTLYFKNGQKLDGKLIGYSEPDNSLTFELPCSPAHVGYIKINKRHSYYLFFKKKFVPQIKNAPFGSLIRFINSQTFEFDLSYVSKVDTVEAVDQVITDPLFVKIGTNPISLFSVADINLSGEIKFSGRITTQFTGHYYSDVDSDIAHSRYSAGARVYFVPRLSWIYPGQWSCKSMSDDILGKFISFKIGYNVTTEQNYISLELYSGESASFFENTFVEYKFGVVRFLRPEEGDDVFTPSAGINVGVLF